MGGAAAGGARDGDVVAVAVHDQVPAAVWAGAPGHLTSGRVGLAVAGWCWLFERHGLSLCFRLALFARACWSGRADFAMPENARGFSRRLIGLARGRVGWCFGFRGQRFSKGNPCDRRGNRGAGLPPCCWMLRTPPAAVRVALWAKLGSPGGGRENGRAVSGPVCGPVRLPRGCRGFRGSTPVVGTPLGRDHRSVRFAVRCGRSLFPLRSR